VFGSDYPTRDGTCIRDFIHVTDLAHAHVAVYQHMRASGESVVFNCGNGRGNTVPEVIRAIERAAGRPLAVADGAVGRRSALSATTLGCRGQQDGRCARGDAL
jgi:UDP-glucose 4-epimerase